MKTVTIPTCANPFVVIVNGIKYTYPAGATMEVPDDVAEVIEQHEEAKTEPAPVLPPFATVPSESGGGGGGFPVVNITSVVRQLDGTSYGTELTEAENAALTAVATSQTPIIVDIPFEIDDGFILHFHAIFYYCANDVGTFYSSFIVIGLAYLGLNIALTEGVWAVEGRLTGNV